MKRTLLIPLVILLMASMACSLFTPKPAEPTKVPAIAAPIATEPPAATETAVQAVEATAPPAEEPTNTEAAPTDVPATEPPAATATATKPASYKDTFDRSNTDWSKPVIITSQAAGRQPYVKVTVESGTMRFAIDDKDTYVYKFLLKGPEGAATVEADFQNKGAIDTAVAFVCKASQDYTSWFEVRVSATNNYYYFFKYDKSMKDTGGKSPYLMLGKGHMKIDEYFPLKPNHLIFSCTDDTLTLDVNNGKLKASQSLDSTLDGNITGVGVLSSALLPATIDFETVSVH